MLNRTLAPESRQVDHIHFIQPQRQQLDNGINVFTINAGQQDLVRIEFIFDNVNWDETKPLQALSAAHLINNGTKDLSARQIAEIVDYYGAFLQTEYSADQSGIKLYSLTKHLPSILPILKAILTESVFPDKELDIFKQNQKQSLQVSLQKNDFLARKHFAHSIFGDTPYGSDINPQDYDAVQQKDLLSYFKAGYTPQNCTIIAAGKFEEKEYQLLNKLFGTHWHGENSAPNDFVFELPEKKDVLIERPDALQSAIRMGAISITRKHHDFAGLQVLNCLLGGYFGSRLMANIREDKGYTYGIGSAVVSLKSAGYFFIATEVGAEVCQSALKEIEKEIYRLKTDPIPEQELELVRSYMLGSMLGSLENAFSHADKFKNIYFSGLDYAYYDNYIQTVKSITAGELQQLAYVYLNDDLFTKVVVGKTT